MKDSRIASAALAALLLLTLTACQTGQETASSQTELPAGVAVQVTEVTRQTISTQNKVSGKVVADGQESVYVTANAECIAVYVEAGDEVTAGEKICTLDMASTLSSYNAANISYQSAVQSYQDQEAIFDKQIALAEKNLNDLKALYEIGAASQAEIDSAELNLMTAQASKTSTLAQLEAGMQSYKSNVEQLAAVLENVDAGGNVIAPVSGTVVTLNAAEGGFVSASMPVAVIDGVDTMKVEVSVSEALIPKLNQGDEVDVSISSLGVETVGTVRSIQKSANAQTKLYTVTVGFEEDIEGLLAGMFADVSFRTETSENTVVIPSQAILTSNNVSYVFVVENDTARYQEVETGLSGNGVTEITSGLEEGQQLVTVGQDYLSDGDAVRIVSGEG